jgi:hypothetical protein
LIIKGILTRINLPNRPLLVLLCLKLAGMKKKILFLSVIMATLTISVVLLSKTMDEEICHLINHGDCPKKAIPKPTRKQSLGSSPDEINYRGFNRLIVATFR